MFIFIQERPPAPRLPRPGRQHEPDDEDDGSLLWPGFMVNSDDVVAVTMSRSRVEYDYDSSRVMLRGGVGNIECCREQAREVMEQLRMIPPAAPTPDPVTVCNFIHDEGPEPDVG